MRFIVLTLFMLFLVACAVETNIKTTLNATQDVQKGDDVFYAQEVVGEITNIDQLNGKTILSIALSEKGASLIKQDAAVVVNRLKPTLPVEIYNKRDAVLAVQDGQELQGLNSMFQLGAWMMGDSLKIGSSEDSLLGYVNAFQRYLQGDKFQDDKKALQEGVEQLSKEAENMAEVLSKELEKASIDMAQAEVKAAQAIEELGQELAPVVGELARSGKMISDELNKFVKNIENKNAEGKELGTTVLKSLLLALEKVNQGIEQSQSELQSKSDDKTTQKVGKNEAVEQKMQNIKEPTNKLNYSQSEKTREHTIQSPKGQSPKDVSTEMSAEKVK